MRQLYSDELSTQPGILQSTRQQMPAIDIPDERFQNNIFKYETQEMPYEINNGETARNNISNPTEKDIVNGPLIDTNPFAHYDTAL